MDNQNTQSNPQPANPPIENPVPQTVTPPPSKSFLSTKIILLIAIIIILIASTGTYLALNSKLKPAPIVSEPIPTSTSTPTAIIDETANWKTFQSLNLPISLSYPNTYKATEGTSNTSADQCPKINYITLTSADNSILTLQDCTLGVGLDKTYQKFEFSNDLNTFTILGSIKSTTQDLGPGFATVTKKGGSVPALYIQVNFNQNINLNEKKSDWEEMQKILKNLLINPD